MTAYKKARNGLVETGTKLQKELQETHLLHFPFHLKWHKERFHHSGIIHRSKQSDLWAYFYTSASF